MRINGAIKDSLKYAYDNNGNIAKVFENGQLAASYEYDRLSRLTRENNNKLKKTFTYSYDLGGNIISKTEFPYTLSSEPLYGTMQRFSYAQSGWKDQLIEVNGEKFIYDALGNPTKYRNKNLVWSHGRQLDKFDDIEFKYNANGIRTTKKVGNKETRFYLSGNKVMVQETNNNRLFFCYGADGIEGFIYEGIGTYHYKKNLQGDIVSIFDTNGIEIAKYAYDAWGNHKTYALNNGEYVDVSTDISYTISGNNNKLVAELNPFRYRSYYYDLETNLYYLNSRYYDSSLGRFINADDISVIDNTMDDFNGINLYAYCYNNPVNMLDSDGTFAWLIALIIGVVVGAVAVGTTVGIIAYNNGARGWDLFKKILGGAILGGIIGGFIALAITFAPAIGSFLKMGFTLGGQMLLTSAGEVILVGGITITGAQILTGAGILAGIGAGYMFSKRDPSTNKPSWVDGSKYNPGQTPQQNAHRMLDEKYGPGNWKGGAGSEFSKIVKWIFRHLLRKY